MPALVSRVLLPLLLLCSLLPVTRAANPSFADFLGTNGITVTTPGTPPLQRVIYDASGLQPGNVTLSNLVFTGAITNLQAATGIALGTNGGIIWITNTGTAVAGVTNVVSLSTSNATSQPITNSFANGILTLFGLEAGANITLTPNGSNIVVATGGGVGEANVNGEISSTNDVNELFGLVYGKVGITNLLRSISSANGLVGTNQGTNIALAIDPTVVASQANLTTVSNWASSISNYVTAATNSASVTGWITLRQPATATLSNLSSNPYKGYTNEVFGGTNISVRTAGGTNFIDTIGNLNNWSQIPTGAMATIPAVTFLTNWTDAISNYVTAATNSASVTGWVVLRQPANVWLTNISGTGAITNLVNASTSGATWLGWIRSTNNGDAILKTVTGSGAITITDQGTNIDINTSGVSGEANVNGEVSLTNATLFGWVFDKVGVTNRLRSIRPSWGLVGTNESTNIAVAVDPAVIASQANLSGASNFLFDWTGAVSNYVTASTNSLLVTGYIVFRQPANAVLSNLVGTVANNVTNVVSLSTTNATSKPLTNSYTAGVLTLRGIEAGANIAITENASNYVIATSGGVGEANVNGEVSLTNNANGIYGLVYDKVGITNRIKSLSQGNGIIITNDGTNLPIAINPAVMASQANLTSASNFLFDWTGSVSNLAQTKQHGTASLTNLSGNPNVATNILGAGSVTVTSNNLGEWTITGGAASTEVWTNENGNIRPINYTNSISLWTNLAVLNPNIAANGIAYKFSTFSNLAGTTRFLSVGNGTNEILNVSSNGGIQVGANTTVALGGSLAARAIESVHFPQTNDPNQNGFLFGTVHSGLTTIGSGLAQLDIETNELTMLYQVFTGAAESSGWTVFADPNTASIYGQVRDRLMVIMDPGADPSIDNNHIYLFNTYTTQTNVTSQLFEVQNNDDQVVSIATDRSFRLWNSNGLGYVAFSAPTNVWLPTNRFLFSVTNPVAGQVLAINSVSIVDGVSSITVTNTATSGDAGGTNARQFGTLILTNISGTGAITNLVNASTSGVTWLGWIRSTNNGDALLKTITASGSATITDQGTNINVDVTGAPGSSVTVWSNSVNVVTAATNLNFLTGSNMTFQITNVSGQVDIMVNANTQTGGGGLNTMISTNLALADRTNWMILSEALRGITNGWFVDYEKKALTSGVDRAYSLLYLSNALFVGISDANPKFIKFPNAYDLSTYQETNLFNDGLHLQAVDMFYSQSKGKIYVLFDHATDITITEIDPVTLATNDVVFQTTTINDTRSFTTDETNVWVAGFGQVAADGFSVLQYKLSDWSEVGLLDGIVGGPTPIYSQRWPIRYDSRSGRIYGMNGSNSIMFGWSAPANNMSNYSFRLSNLPAAELGSQFQFIGNYAYTLPLASSGAGGAESVSNVMYRLNKATLEIEVIQIGPITTGSTNAGPERLYFDGRYIWTIAITNNRVTQESWLTRVNPVTLEVDHTFLGTNHGYSITGDGTNTLFIGAQDLPGAIIRLRAPIINSPWTSFLQEQLLAAGGITLSNVNERWLSISSTNTATISSNGVIVGAFTNLNLVNNTLITNASGSISIGFPTGGGGLTTNANQFGASVELTLKSGANLTNTMFWSSNLTGPGIIATATTDQITNLVEMRGTNGYPSVTISSNGLALVGNYYYYTNIAVSNNTIAFRTNNISLQFNNNQTFTNALQTNLVFQITNSLEGVTVNFDVFGAGRLGNGRTNAWQIFCTAIAGTTIYWPPGVTNGNYDLLLNSNQTATLTYRCGLGGTNIMASYLVREGIGAN